MKIFLLSLLILGFFVVRAQLPSNCNVPPVFSYYYEPDVKDMALKWLYSIKSVDTASIDIPQWCQDTIWSGLAAIYNRHDQPEVDSVFNKYCVHTAIDIWPVSVIYREIIVDLDTTYIWTNNWRKLNTTTGIPSLDSLLAKYGFTVTDTSFLYSSYPYVVLSTTQYINVTPFCDSLVYFQGIVSAYPNAYTSTGPSNIISFYVISGVKYYNFSFAWGADVGFHHAWRYKVNPDCSIEFLGNEVGCGSGWGWHPHLPEPVNCNILYIPNHEAHYQKLEVYPNPSSGSLTISINDIYSRNTLTILNLIGQELFRQTIFDKKIQLDINNLPNGVYFVKLQNDKAVEVRKIIKE